MEKVKNLGVPAICAGCLCGTLSDRKQRVKIDQESLDS